MIDKTQSRAMDVTAALKEAYVLSMMRHPHILKCFDVYHSSDKIVMILPLMTSNLREYMDKCGGALPENHAKQVFRMMASGLEYIHRKNMVHCDLKLDNILVSYDSETLNITDLCISDFGLFNYRKKI